MLQAPQEPPASPLYAARLAAIEAMADSDSPHDEFVLLSLHDADEWYANNEVPLINLADPAVRAIFDSFPPDTSLRTPFIEAGLRSLRSLATRSSRRCDDDDGGGNEVGDGWDDDAHEFLQDLSLEAVPPHPPTPP